MPLNQKRKSLLNLPALVITQSGEFPGEDKIKNRSVFARTIPADISERALTTLWLVDDAARQYQQSLQELLAEGESGDLEHLAQRDIERSLWRLVCETWLSRSEIRLTQMKEKVEEFISSLRRSPEEWEVIWEINDLATEVSFNIAGVEFFSFKGEAAERWMPPEGHPWREVSTELLGKTFALATVNAGSKEKAIERAKVSIDDALGVLRVALVPHRWLHDDQLLQRRGLHYFAGLVSEGKPTVAGAQREHDSIPLEIGDDLREFLDNRIAEMAVGSDDLVPAKLREPFRR